MMVDPMTLYTLDEARAAVVESSALLLHRVRADALTLRRLLRGERRGAVKGLHPADRALAAAHRALLDCLRSAGYASAIDDELDGICSAVFGEDGACDPSPLLAAAAAHYLSQPAA